MMEYSRLLVYCAVFSSVFVDVYGIDCYTYYHSDELGHTRYQNGTFVWAAIPPIVNSGQKKETRSDGWDVTVDFAIAIVDSVQTQTFPYDLLRRIIRNNYSDEEVVEYQTNVIVVTSMGVLLALSILAGMAIYKIRRWRRGKSGIDDFNVNWSRFFITYAKYILAFGACLVLVDIIFVLCSLIVSGHAFVGALNLADPVHSAMDDVLHYFVGMRTHYDFIAANTSRWFIDQVLISDMKEVGRMIWESGRDQFLPQIAPTFALVSDLDARAAESLAYLTKLESDIHTAVVDVVGEVDTVLTAVHYNLSQAVTDYSCVGCDGSCTGCSAIVPDDIFLMADFSTLPSISSNVDSLTNLLSATVAETSRSPEYYFLYGIGEQISQNPNVTSATNVIIEDLLAYSNTWGNSTNDIIYPNRSTFWFDSLRPKFDDFYADLKVKEIVRFVFTLVFCVATYVVIGLTIFSLYKIYKLGFFSTEKTGSEDFSKPKRILGWCLVGQMTLASCHLLMSAAGFYTGANLQKAVCEPGESLKAASYVVDYYGAMPGHDGFYLSSVLLGNGTATSLKLANMLNSCSNGTGAYSEFLHDVIVPHLQQDLQNYTQHFTNLTAEFDKMRVSLDPNTTLVPPDFKAWVDNFTLFTDFNYTRYNEMLNGVVIAADVDTFTANLDHIYNTPAISGGPFDPAKSRLPIASALIQGQKTNIARVNVIQTSLASLFSNFETSRNNILTTVNQTMEQLLDLEPALVNMSGPAINTGVDQYMAEFLTVLDNAANTTWKWVGEAAPCGPITDAYYSALTSFCDQYADYENASWLLLGHTCFFLLTVCLVSFCLYRAIPDPHDHTLDNPFDVSAKTRILMIESADKRKRPIVAVAVRDKKELEGIDNPVDVNDDPEQSKPSHTNMRYQKVGNARRTIRDSWIDSRPSLARAEHVSPTSNITHVRPMLQLSTVDELEDTDTFA